MWTPEQLARAYDLSVSSLWRGDREGAPFLRWLDGFRAERPAIPPGLPAAYSVLGGGGRGIRWYADGDAILGVPGELGDVCYRVPRGAAPATQVDAAIGAGAVRASAASGPAPVPDGPQVLPRNAPIARRCTSA